VKADLDDYNRSQWGLALIQSGAAPAGVFAVEGGAGIGCSGRRRACCSSSLTTTRLL
jgi:hypothetical protein